MSPTLFIILVDVALFTAIIITLVSISKIRKEVKENSKQHADAIQGLKTFFSQLPIGLFTMTEDGIIDSGNALFRSIYSKLTNGAELFGINHFESPKILSSNDLDYLRSTGLLDRLYKFSSPEKCFCKFRIKSVTNEKGVRYYSGSVINKTDDLEVSNLNRRILNAFRQAIDHANIAFATINLFDDKYTATDSLYAIMRVKPGIPITELVRFLSENDMDKVRNFVNRVKEIQSNPEQYKKYSGYNIATSPQEIEKIELTANVRTRISGNYHYFRLFCVLSDFAPDDGKIIVDIFLLSIDNLVRQKETLLASLRKIKATDNMKNKFIAYMSSKFASPLNIILSCTENIFKSEDKADKELIYKRLCVESSRLLLTIGEVENAARIEIFETAKNIVETDLGTTAASAINDINSIIEDGVTLNYKRPWGCVAIVNKVTIKELIRTMLIDAANRVHNGEITLETSIVTDMKASSGTNIRVSIFDSGDAPSDNTLNGSTPRLEVHSINIIIKSLGGSVEFKNKESENGLNSVICTLPADVPAQREKKFNSIR